MGENLDFKEDVQDDGAGDKAKKLDDQSDLGWDNRLNQPVRQRSSRRKK